MWRRKTFNRTEHRFSCLMSRSATSVTIGEYLFTRLKQLGVASVFGVPGDFNLGLLDYIDDVDGIKWVGNTNELNAAYCADGYARVTRQASALITTFGVGELSAVNGVAGSMSERLPVVHIVGIPSTLSQAHKEVLHHSLGNGDFRVFAKMSESITVAQTLLEGNMDIPSEIDRVLRACMVSRAPVYIGFPSDFPSRLVDAARLRTPIIVQAYGTYPQIEHAVAQKVCELLYAAQRPVMLVDTCVSRYNVVDYVLTLLEKTKLVFFQTEMAKGVLSEDHPQYAGLYLGANTPPLLKEVIEGSDLVISLGGLKSDWNTGGFSYGIKSENSVEIHSTWAIIKGHEFSGIRLSSVLKSITSMVDPGKLRPMAPPRVLAEDGNPDNDLGGETIQHTAFWPRMAQFLERGDIIIAETGTSTAGVTSMNLPPQATIISQLLWGSIGYSVPAAFGALMATRDMGNNRRVVLYVGDGSLQLTATEISSMVREGLNPVIFVLNNGGYTIERKIHGENSAYNDVQNWKYTMLPQVFGSTTASTYTTKNLKELNAALKSVSAAKDVLSVVEVMMDKHDAPEGTKSTGIFAEKLNSGKVWGLEA